MQKSLQSGGEDNCYDCNVLEEAEGFAGSQEIQEFSNSPTSSDHGLPDMRVASAVTLRARLQQMICRQGGRGLVPIIASWSKRKHVGEKADRETSSQVEEYEADFQAVGRMLGRLQPLQRINASSRSRGPNDAGKISGSQDGIRRAG